MFYQIDKGCKRLLGVIKDRRTESLAGFFEAFGPERCARIKVVNLRGKGPAEQIKSLDGIGYDGITMPLKSPKDLEKLEASSSAGRKAEVVKKLLRVETSAELLFSADKVWKLIAGFDTLPDYHASITTREFSYKTTDLIECRFPLLNYQAFVRLEAINPNKCRLHWGSVFTVEGATEKEGYE